MSIRGLPEKKKPGGRGFGWGQLRVTGKHQASSCREEDHSEGEGELMRSDDGSGPYGPVQVVRSAKIARKRFCRAYRSMGNNT